VLRFLTLGGLALQLAGATVTGWGASLIWHQAANGEGLLDPATRATVRLWRLLTNPFLRWIGRPRSQTIQLGGISSAVSSGSARLSKGYSPLDPDMALRDAVTELDRRIKKLIAEIGRSENQLLDKMQDQDRRHDKLSQAFNQYMSEQDENTKRRDRRGIRFEAAGLALVTIGAILQALGSLLAPSQ